MERAYEELSRRQQYQDWDDEAKYGAVGHGPEGEDKTEEELLKKVDAMKESAHRSSVEMKERMYRVRNSLIANQDLDTEMAEKVMGWHSGPKVGLMADDYAWIDRQYRCVTLKRDWHPTSDMNQAMMCLEETKMVWHLWACLDGTINCEVDGYLGAQYEKSPARAICLAIHEALKEVENDMP